ncbi:enolase C-terminal domain-like protein [Rugosimonospora acidiphila]|uniref:Enolase C-terminal domain-like protein n=1 Tax=Rugosimonospora acidiphila TaxID=556531 RepID=A0ABP9RP37_9ACTN
MAPSEPVKHEPISSVHASAYTVPTEAPEADGTLCWQETTAIVVSVTAGDCTGLGWSYGLAASSEVVNGLLASAVVGTDPVDIPGCHAAMAMAARNALLPGLVGIAVSAVDIALWDLKAQLLGVPLVELFGRCRQEVPLYGSGGFTTLTDAQLRRQLSGWVSDDGMTAVKIKIAERWGADEARDLRRMALARETVGPNVTLMVDANGGYGAKQAVRVARAAGDLGIGWLEEPVSSDDLASLALIRGMVEPDIAAGEYGTDPNYFRRMCAAGAVDCLQIDATRCGGYTGFLASAAVADSFGLPVSAHCAPQLHAPVCAAVPNLRHVEWFADHVRVDRLLFEGLVDPVAGAMRPQADRPGGGVRLREEAASLKR